MRWKFSKKSYRLCITFAFLNFDFEPSAFIRLCPGWDSNPQVRKGQRILSPSRMPIPPPGLNFLFARNCEVFELII